MKIAMAAGQVISSPANSLLKQVRRSVSRGEATAEGFVVAESFHLLAEALRSRLVFRAVLAAESVQTEAEQVLLTHPEIPLRIIEDRVFQSIAATEHSQGLISLVRLPVWNLRDLFRGRPLVIVVDGVQDPGNAGTIVRSAEAFGATGVVFTSGSVNPENPKALRAAAGSLFRIPFARAVAHEDLAAELPRHEVKVIAADAHAGQLLNTFDFRVPSAIVIGSEAHGVSADLREGAQAVRIPTVTVESLNAATSAAVILYEAASQRARAGSAIGTTKTP